ncbi:hypothetical protein D3C78_1337850 [compost metagenome]
MSGAYFHQAANNIPHHMMYKGICFDIHHHIRAITADVYVHHVSPRRTRLALHRAKRGKVIFTNQRLRSALHTFRIQRRVKVRHTLPKYRRAKALIVDDVAIATRRGAETRVKIIRHIFHPAHSDVTR